MTFLLTLLKHLAAMLLGPLHLAGGTGIVSTTVITGNCPSAYIQDVYDTPSGKLEAGFYDPRLTGVLDFTGTTTLAVAHVTGQIAFVECYSPAGIEHDVQITLAQFAAFSAKGGQITQEQISVPTTELAPL